MPISKRQLAKHWTDQIEIDYYAAFIKSWIAFNAWLNYKYDNINDVQKIENLVDGSLLKDIICRVIREQDDAEMLLSRIAKLHELLESREIKNKEKRVSLTKICVKRDPINTEETKNRVTYSFKCEGNKNKCIITNSLGEKLFEFIDDSKNYSEEKCQEKLNQDSLTPTQKSYAFSLYKQLAPTEEINLLNTSASEYYEIGQFRFIKNEKHIFQALIETIYDIRCLLFHGDIEPEENSDIYEQAYYIVKYFVNKVS